MEADKMYPQVLRALQAKALFIITEQFWQSGEDSTIWNRRNKTFMVKKKALGN